MGVTRWTDESVVVVGQCAGEKVASEANLGIADRRIEDIRIALVEGGTFGCDLVGSVNGDIPVLGVQSYPAQQSVSSFLGGAARVARIPR